MDDKLFDELLESVKEAIKIDPKIGEVLIAGLIECDIKEELEDET